jgi:hypothetical protein
MSNWITAISLSNFELSRSRSFSIAGYRRKVHQIEVGDKLVFYILGVHKFGAICNVTSSLYADEIPYWPDGIWPYRFKTEPYIVLSKEKMLDIGCLVSTLSFIPEKLKESGNWGVIFRQSPKKILQGDFNLIEQEMKKLQAE